MALSTIGTNSIADSAITSAKTTIGVKEADQWRLTTDFSGPSSSTVSVLIGKEMILFLIK